MKRAYADRVSDGQELPDGWAHRALGEVARIEFSSVDKKSIEGEEPVELCNYTDVFYNRHIHSDLEFMAATATARECERWSLRQGDVLFTKDSETRTEIGIPAYVTEDLPDVLCGYHLGRARPISETIYGSYLAESLRSPLLSRQFARIANGVTRFGLTLGATRGLTLPVPPLREQRAIAEILDAIDDATGRTDRVIAATERLREALLHELLPKGLPAWHNRWQEHPNLGTLPAGWRVVLLGDVAHVEFSVVDKKTVDGEIPVKLCNYKDVFYNRRIHSGMAFMRATATSQECKRWNLRKGDVLFTKDSETRTEIGIPAHVTEDLPNVLCGYHLGRLRPESDQIDGAYLAEALRSSLLSSQFARIANGVTRYGLTLSATRRALLPLPPLEEQSRIASLLETVDTLLETTRAERTELHALAASTADVLLSGTVRVRRVNVS